jgi:hypothetical protein
VNINARQRFELGTRKDPDFSSAGFLQKTQESAFDPSFCLSFFSFGSFANCALPVDDGLLRLWMV